MSVAIICVCVMVVCGVFVLREYTLAKNYEETSCRLTNITYSGDIGCMHCSGVKETNKGAEGGSGGSCAHTHFPCLHVIVSYSYNSTAQRAAMLYENSVQAVGAYSQVGTLSLADTLLTYFLSAYFLTTAYFLIFLLNCFLASLLSCELTFLLAYFLTSLLS